MEETQEDTLDYGLYRHISGEVYAVIHLGDHVGGVAGPLHYEEYRRPDILDEVEYRTDDAAWAQQELGASRLRHLLL